MRRIRDEKETLLQAHGSIEMHDTDSTAYFYPVIARSRNLYPVLIAFSYSLRSLIVKAIVFAFAVTYCRSPCNENINRESIIFQPHKHYPKRLIISGLGSN